MSWRDLTSRLLYQRTLYTYILKSIAFFKTFFSVTNNPYFCYYRNNVWAVCPTGYFIRGFYRNDNALLYNIEEATCCKPNSFPNRYEECYEESIGVSFDNIGLSECTKNDYYVVGIYKGGCDDLHCIETLKCCKMVVGE